MGFFQYSLNFIELISLDMLLDDIGECLVWKEGGRYVKIVVSFQEEMKWKEDFRLYFFFIGCIGVSGKMKWDVFDGVVRWLFKEYIIYVDLVSQLGLNLDSVFGYSIGEIKCSNIFEILELFFCGYLVGENIIILVIVKGFVENSLDLLVFEFLIFKFILQCYVFFLIEYCWIIFFGFSGIGKIYLVNWLFEYMVF